MYTYPTPTENISNVKVVNLYEGYKKHSHEEHITGKATIKPGIENSSIYPFLQFFELSEIVLKHQIVL